MIDSDKILMLQRYLLYADTAIYEDLQRSKQNISTLNDIYTLMQLQAKYEAFRHIQKNIEKILYFR